MKYRDIRMRLVEHLVKVGRLLCVFDACESVSAEEACGIFQRKHVVLRPWARPSAEHGVGGLLRPAQALGGGARKSGEARRRRGRLFSKQPRRVMHLKV